jgi:hypothetical protein
VGDEAFDVHVLDDGTVRVEPGPGTTLTVRVR